MPKKTLVSGGAGYVGSALVPALLDQGHEVTVLDTFWYWKSPEAYLEGIGRRASPSLRLVTGDIRNTDDVRRALEGVDTVIQLACISNDPSWELNETFSYSVNIDGNQNVIAEAKKAGISRFIYASSSSVYGVKEEPDVTEEMSLEPLTIYSKTKVQIEKFLLDNLDGKFQGVIIRPSTVCGLSPRLRLDVVVNILTNFAVNKGKIRVFGGDQLRPNIHIRDMVDLYVRLVDEDIGRINREIFNAGWENLKVMEIAQLVKKVVGDVAIEVVPTDDNRSYHVSSRKITDRLGYHPKHGVEEAISELKDAFLRGAIPNPDDDVYHNVRRMKRLLGV